jgi:hypothetical protein
VRSCFRAFRGRRSLFLSQIVFFGAEFTQLDAIGLGRVAADENAAAVKDSTA